MWHENGQKNSEGKFKNGKADGKWNSWYENGQIESWYVGANKDMDWNYGIMKMVRYGERDPIDTISNMASGLNGMRMVR